MKPPPFAYFAPRTLEEATQLINEYQDDGKLLGGGQSFVPVLSLRLASPSTLIDLNQVEGLGGASEMPGGGLRVRGLTRHREIELSPLVAKLNPLLTGTMPHVAHVQIRNRGTTGGSCSHADPAAEMPAIALTCDAEFVLTSVTGERVVPASEFFQGVFTTALEANEILTEIRYPAWPKGRRWGFEEMARRRGDFAIVGSAVLVDFDEAGRCSGAKVTVFGAGDTPMRVSEAEELLVGKGLTPETMIEAGRMTSAAIEPRDDLHASADYRRDVSAVMVRRALEQAASPIRTGVAA